MAITDGMAVGWTSPMIPYFLSEKTHIKMTKSQAEWLESYLLFGAICGLPITAYVTDKLGRKISLILACSCLVLTWTVIAVADCIEYLSVSRFFQGLGLNMAFVAAPMYVGEISHKSIRGFLSSLIFVMNVLGLVIMYTTGPLLPYYVPSVIANAVLILEIVVFAFMPESPYFLMTKGKHVEAKTSLQKFRRCHDVDEELDEIKSSIEEDNKVEKAGVKEMFTVKNYRKALVLMTLLNVSQLFCSIEVIMMNLHEILSGAGSIYVSTTNAGILFAIMNLIAAVISSLVVDKFGRVKLLVISVIPTGICLFLLALYFHLKSIGYDTESYSWVPIVSVMTYGLAFKLGLGMVPIVMTSELFASKIKSFGMAYADAVYVVMSVVALQVFFQLRDNFGLHAPFYLFFACSILTIVFVILFVPETKGKSLDESQRILKNENTGTVGEQRRMISESKDNKKTDYNDLSV